MLRGKKYGIPSVVFQLCAWVVLHKLRTACAAPFVDSIRCFAHASAAFVDVCIARVRYVCMHGCMYTRTSYICMYMYVYVCICMYMYVCNACMYIGTYLRTYVRTIPAPQAFPPPNSAPEWYPQSWK